MAEKHIIIKGRAVVRGKTEGEALVSPPAPHGLGQRQPQAGLHRRAQSSALPRTIQRIILVRGSGGFQMYGRTRQYGVNPAAMLYNEGMSIATFTALTLNRPCMTDFEIDVTEAIETGDWVIVNADEGYIEIIKKDKELMQRRAKKYLAQWGKSKMQE